MKLLEDFVPSLKPLGLLVKALSESKRSILVYFRSSLTFLFDRDRVELHYIKMILQ